MFVPDAPVNDMRSVTMEADTGDTLIPSLQQFAPQPVVIEDAPDWNRWLWIGGLLVAVYFLADIKPGR